MTLDVRGGEVLEKARKSPGHYILAFWHSRWVLMPFVYPGPRLVVMSSQHRDSELLARVLTRFGLDLARGSTTRGGMAAFRTILRKAAEGSDVGFTPDGPRGPRRRVQPGVIAVGRLSGLPILPVTYSAARARRIGSWDRTMVPRMFSKGLVLFGSPVRVPRNADEAEQESLRLALERELDRITDLADVETGIGPEDPREPVGTT